MPAAIVDLSWHSVTSAYDLTGTKFRVQAKVNITAACRIRLYNTTCLQLVTENNLPKRDIAVVIYKSDHVILNKLIPN